MQIYFILALTAPQTRVPRYVVGRRQFYTALLQGAVEASTWRNPLPSYGSFNNELDVIVVAFTRHNYFLFNWNHNGICAAHIQCFICACLEIFCKVILHRWFALQFQLDGKLCKQGYGWYILVVWHIIIWNTFVETANDYDCFMGIDVNNCEVGFERSEQKIQFYCIFIIIWLRIVFCSYIIWITFWGLFKLRRIPNFV